MSYSAAAIGLAGLGLNSYVQRMSKRYNPSGQVVQRTMPMNKVDYNLARIQALSRQVNRIKPAVESTTIPFNLATLTGGAVEANNDITANFGANSDFQSKVLGDKVRLLNYHIRWNIPESGVSKMRLILYLPYNTGERITSFDYQSIPDSSKFRVLRDWTIWPNATNNSNRPNIGALKVSLGSRMARYDRSTATSMSIQSGEVILFSLITSTAATTSAFQHKLSYQNK
jgi:hypothetical protein